MLKILYGTIHCNIDITEICKNKLLDNNSIIIPPRENNRIYLFSDPVIGLMKKIIVIFENRIFEFGDDVAVKINLKNYSVDTISKDLYFPKMFELYNLEKIREREETLFDMETYANSSKMHFTSKEEAMNHWYILGKKQGYVYSRSGHHTLLKIIVPVLNEPILLEPFLEYYGNLIGFENIIILDNKSTIESIHTTFSKYQDKVTIFRNCDYFDLEYEKGKFDILVSNLKKECKFISKIDCDEFLSFYDYNYDSFFPKNHFLNYLEHTNQHIGTFFLENLYTKEIMTNPSDPSNWILFQHIDNFKNKMNLYWGKTLLNTNLEFENHILTKGNHNGDKKSIYNSLNFYKIICLHLCNVDIDNRIQKSEKVIPEILDLKYLDYEVFLLALENYKLPSYEGRHKLEELKKYYRNKENYKSSLLHDNKIAVETNIIQSTILNDNYIFTNFKIF